jgi:Holliday junction resolvase
MNLDDLTLGQIKDEKSLHNFLKKRGFSTNYNKELNANGVDIVAMKDGHVFNIEFKKIVLNRTTKAYKLSDEKVNGDILLALSPSGHLLPVLNEKTSTTKTIRFLNML